MTTESGRSFPVVLCIERRLHRREADQVKALFDRHPGPVTVSVVSRSVEIEREHPDDSLCWPDIFVAIEQVRATENIAAETFVCLLTTTENERNWYAAQDADNMRSGFGHVSDFSWVTTAPNYAISAHYVLKGIFNALLDEAGVDWESMWHDSPRGCFFDFCQSKADLNFKLRTADICGDCLEVFQSIGIPNELFVQTISIMEETRRQAINTSQFLPPVEGFNDWPFPVAITRHKIVQATNPLLRFMLLLDHFDSLVRYFYLANETVHDRRPKLEDKPSLGWWVDQLAHSLKGEKDFREVVSIAQQEKVVALRNERRGHGWMSMNEEAYRAEAEHLESVLKRIEVELQPFLERYRLVIPRLIRLDEGKYFVEGEQLVGSHVLHRPFIQPLNDDPRTLGLTAQNKVYITDMNMSWFKSFSPYIRYEDCPECNHPRVLITDGGEQYIDAFMGHRVIIPG